MTDAGFRCSTAARDRGDALAGTASTVRAFLVVENAGPWGTDALRDCRLPDGLGPRIKTAAARARVRPLLARTGERGRRDAPVRVLAAWAHPVHPWLEQLTVDSCEELLEAALTGIGRGERPGWTPVDEPFLGVCTHGRHDACCAERGRPAARALRAAGVPGAWEVSHVGGDRFAGNMVVLPHGLYYGGLDDRSVLEVAEAHRQGRVHLDHLRGRSAYSMPVQYAEVALRRELAETGLDALRLRRRHPQGEDSVLATFTHLAGGRRTDWEVLVRTEHGEPSRLTCSATRDNPLPRHRVVRIAPAG